MLSFVRIKRGWVALDPHRGIYFRNHTGGLATIEEMHEQDWHIVNLANRARTKATYEQYFDENLPPMIEKIGSGFTRANTQSPINRLRFQLHKWFSGKAPLLE
jgi:hypothetical protein